MIDVRVIMCLLLLHFLGDFILQSEWMATNKSRDFGALFAHTMVYSMCFLPFFGWKFALVTFLFHTGIDGFTSQITSYLWNRDELHWFFVTIGFDQFLHYVQLVGVYYLLRG